MKPSIYPSYYEEFSCIGPECEDSCCDENWTIAIDQKTYFKYLKDPHLKQYLVKRKNPTRTNYGDLKRTSTGACALLSECGICTVHRDYGEDYLSETCAIYPRARYEVDNIIERSLTPSCPEVARQLLFQEEGLSFTQNDTFEESWEQTIQKFEIPLLWPLRISIIRLLQNRTAPFNARFAVVGMYLNKMQQYSMNEQLQKNDTLTALYEAQLSNETFVSQLENRAPQHYIYLKLATDILSERIKKGFGSIPYVVLIDQISQGLKLDDEISDIDKTTHFQEMKTRYYDPYMSENEHILENYFVNQVFKELAPFDEKTYMQSYLKLITHYMLLKLHLVGLAAYHEGLTDELVVRAIYLYGRRIEHNAKYLDRMIEKLKKEQPLSLGYLTILIYS